MTGKGNRKADKSQKNVRSKRRQVSDANWKRADEQLDEALRLTFPASDALSIVQRAYRD
jgi:hypothetical protein